jgi:prepilin-type processing-associated H-X9-DG protein
MATTDNSQSRRSGIWFVHNKARISNVLFMDGHVEPISFLEATSSYNVLKGKANTWFNKAWVK